MDEWMKKRTKFLYFGKVNADGVEWHHRRLFILTYAYNVYWLQSMSGAGCRNEEEKPIHVC